MAEAAYEAEDVIESHIVDWIAAEKRSSFGLYKGLQKVIEEMAAIKKEVMAVPDQLRKCPPTSAAPSRSSPSTGQNAAMVGFDDILFEVLDKLVGGQLDRQIIPIVGMGGIGKTTLAKNIYMNRVVVQHFDIRVWVTVSQEYRLREILWELLQEGGGDLNRTNDGAMRDKLHKRLSGRRYLIIMDDIWDVEVWEKLARFFPDNKNGSRIVITTRISNFLLSNSYVLKMGFLDNDKSWSLFSNIVFGGESFPFELEVIGKKIVENCRGLPLSIVVVGGLLAKSERKRVYWEYIADNLNYVVNSEDNEHCLKILHMSYNQLPVYLKPCFLYMGVFSEDVKIRASKLIKMWVAEGFLKPICGTSMEEVGDECLKELVNRNLVVVHESGCTGNIKYCKIHDLLRDLCMREAEKERFYNVVRQHSPNAPQYETNQRRMVIPESTKRDKVLDALRSASSVRSLMSHSTEFLPLHNFRLLRIMTCSDSDYTYFLEDMFQLVNSRYLVLNARSGSKFPSSVHLLWNLHTLIVETAEETAPFEIWNLPRLRHLEFVGGLYLPDPPSCEDDIVSGNLQTLLRIINFKCCNDVVKRIPNIKKLEISYYDKFEEGCLDNIGRLHKLESLYCLSFPRAGDVLQSLTFPYSLKKLTIAGSAVPWEDMLEKIGSLPHLEKLILRFGFFRQGEWETVEGHFPSLKLLEMELCKNLEYWATDSNHFPRLEHLVLDELEDLKEIPSEIGEIPTLRSIKLVYCSNSAVVSAKTVVEEQEELYGEVGLHVRVKARDFEQREELRRLASPNFQFI